MLEGQATIGGGCRSDELTLPGFVHDTCSTVHSLALASPFLSRLPLAEHGFEPVHPGAPLAHPLDDGTAVMLERSVPATAAGLGPDGDAYRRLFEPLVRQAEPLFGELLAPLRPPRHPLLLGSLRPQRGPLRGGLCPLALRGRARPRAAGRVLRPLDAVAASAR